MPAERNVQIRPFFGGFVLETLTVGMYGESRNAIREYIQNGFDSIQRSIKELHQLRVGEGHITIEFDADRDGLTIRDNGAGLPSAIAVSTLTSVGASRKNYATDAGFRGIGRLAGVVFSDEMTFTTKAAGEAERTVVRFDGARMRTLMAPGRGSELTAEELMLACVSAKSVETTASEPPFFEVALRGFQDAPEECTSANEMAKWVSQVAPVPYPDDFPYRDEILAEAKRCGIPVDEVRVTIERADAEILEVRKPYGSSFAVDGADGLIPLVKVRHFHSPGRTWCGWLGIKDVPGSYSDATQRGIRMRAKNIQIDGTDVVAEIFQKRAKSNARYQSWFVGEIFVDPRAVVPNARRDGFEDTPAWRTMAREIAGTVCAAAGTSAQAVSNTGQLEYGKLSEKAEALGERYEGLRDSPTRDLDDTIQFSADITKLQKQVAKASRNAEPATLISLQQLNSQLLDFKTGALAHISAEEPFDAEALEQRARDELLEEISAALSERLNASCLAQVKSILRSEFDWPPQA